VHEQDIEHPIYRYGEAYAASCAGAAACEAFHAEARRKWAAFAAELAHARTVTILESCLLQTPVASMHMARCSAGSVAAHVSETVEILRPLDPAVVYLAPRDPAATLERMRLARGDAFVDYLADLLRQTPYGVARQSVDRAALDEAIAAHYGQQRALLAALPFRTIDITAGPDDWPSARQAIARFLGMPPAALEAAADGVAEPAQLAGRYRDTESDGRLEIAVRGDGLVLQPLGTRLLPRGADAFDLEGFSVRLTFERGGGPAERIHCAARLAEFGKLWVRESHGG
jgi:hypothetical protein